MTFAFNIFISIFLVLHDELVLLDLFGFDTTSFILVIHVLLGLYSSLFHFLHWCHVLLQTQEFLVLGGQTLTEMRDKIYCLTDQMMQKAGQHDPSGYFLVEVWTSTYSSLILLQRKFFTISNDTLHLCRMYFAMIWEIHLL